MITLVSFILAESSESQQLPNLTCILEVESLLHNDIKEADKTLYIWISAHVVKLPIALFIYEIQIFLSPLEFFFFSNFVSTFAAVFWNVFFRIYSLQSLYLPCQSYRFNHHHHHHQESFDSPSPPSLSPHLFLSSIDPVRSSRQHPVSTQR